MRWRTTWPGSADAVLCGAPGDWASPVGGAAFALCPVLAAQQAGLSSTVAEAAGMDFSWPQEIL